MPSCLSQHSEPARKRLLVEKRLRGLRAAVEAGQSSVHIARAAEKVRLAALALIRAKRAMIRECPQRDPDGRQLWNLQDEEQRWLSLSAKAIVEENGADDVQPPMALNV